MAELTASQVYNQGERLNKTTIDAETNTIFAIPMNKYTIFFPSYGSAAISVITLLSCFFYQVLDVRKRQLDEKMEDNRRRQQESIESREELLRELEQVQQLTAREKAEEERKRREREEEMQAQITSRREKAKEQEQLEREEMERERRERNAYNQMLRKEADFMRARGPQARFAPRRRTAFE